MTLADLGRARQAWVTHSHFGILGGRGDKAAIRARIAELKPVLRTLDELGGRTKDIFMLARLERMKRRDIAALDGMTISGVEKHLGKASVHLFRKFGPL